MARSKVIAFVLSAFLMAGCDLKMPKYTIEQGDNIYFAENYKSNGECIEFLDRYDRKIVICGSYTIKDNN